jgi:hypothetical protein
MAVFKAFKPEAMNKIAKAMGYSGDMGQFQSFIEQDPMRQQQMQRYTNAAMQMARGGVVKMQTGGFALSPQNQITYKGQVVNPVMTQAGNENVDAYGFKYQYTDSDFNAATGTADFRQGSPEFKTLSNLLEQQRKNKAAPKKAAQPTQQPVPKSNYPQDQTPEGPIGGGLLEQPYQQNYQSAPMYDQFKQSDYYKNIQNKIGATVTGSATIDGQNYNFPMAMEAEAYGNYMRNLGNYQVGGRESNTGVIGPGMEASVPPMYGPEGTYSLTGRPAPQPITKPAANTGTVAPAQGLTPAVNVGGLEAEAPANVTEATIQRMFQPGLPQGGVTQAAMTPSEAGQYIDPRAGVVTGAVQVPTAMATTAVSAPVQEQQAAQMQAAQAAPAVDAALQATQAAQATVDPRAEVTAAQQTASSVGNLQAAQGNATLIDNPVQRNIQQGELISGAAADAQTAATFTEQVQAAEATPSAQATVQGQLAQLTANFDASNPPAWAAGSLRAATQQMAARGLGASSLAGQAIVQATLEAALPIAQADASVVAQFEAQNLSNRQQRAMLSAQQRAQFLGQEFDQEFQTRVQNSARIGDIANMNFTAEQQVQLENSRAANTMNLNNLSNRQAMVIAEASALANMDMSNLNNRQQAAVQNAQAFLQMDMANLSNQQQTELFKAQQTTQALFTDQAATNAASQFNATSQNQVDQFFANLANQTSQFNAAQANAQAQFNAGQANTIERFNAEMNNQRDQFNAQNQVVIAQSNAQWRRQIATADTAAVNRVNELNASAILDISKTAYNNLWQYYADSMEHAWEAADSELDRLNNLAVAQLSADATKEAQKMASSSAAGSALGGLLGTLGSAFIEFG